MSIPSRTSPVVPGLLLNGLSADMIGDVSVIPYPCNKFSPRLLNPSAMAGSRAAPPLTKVILSPRERWTFLATMVRGEGVFIEKLGEFFLR